MDNFSERVEAVLEHIQQLLPEYLEGRPDKNYLRKLLAVALLYISDPSAEVHACLAQIRDEHIIVTHKEQPIEVALFRVTFALYISHFKYITASPLGMLEDAERMLRDFPRRKN
jgi:hypothetical protein